MTDRVRIRILAKEISEKIMPIILADRILTAAQIAEWVNSGFASGTINKLLHLALMGQGTGAFEVLKNIKSGLTSWIGVTTDKTFYTTQGIKNNTMMTWVIESGNPCPDCIDRNGQVKTFQEWVGLGLPREGATICGAYCKCELHETATINNKEA